MNLPLHGFGAVAGGWPNLPLKALSLREALALEYPLQRVAVLVGPHENVADTTLRAIGAAAVVRGEPEVETGLPTLSRLSADGLLNSGDVFRVRPDNGRVSVLYRRGANANSLLVTERCNSPCLMCSQPPRPEDDGWLIGELRDIIPLIDQDLPSLGLTGGEPTLLGERLAELLALARQWLPNTGIHILSNGRTFSDPRACESFDGTQQQVTWGIPLYGAVPWRHDHIVQARGAFDQTISGLLNLAERGHAVEIRVVLHRLTADHLFEIAGFIQRCLPFAIHVAFMGLEPMGYAKMNRELLWIDPIDLAPALTEAIEHLDIHGIRASIYNLPLCLLPAGLRRFARQSISDWKNVFDAACSDCVARAHCCGFFASTGPAWRSRGLKPLSIEEFVR
ncbi:His-Xaa-Ser system radical SAM maturase HxsC [Oleomonas cavernae]|uniref:His-Xaa-Ser system radical SAM maturase HxsC n=1 Tax=Oleomonas cavernae TaxID=2320859 RepID=A0A418WH69_9PROT|nr:His-Xaa-Ser system radical SAM maturase HxsC [Oleomonas cavernae]RJF89345.1 His-Xaa-Ser system radical SAM maturase HxsC [Oleomonas cavernae]